MRKKIVCIFSVVSLAYIFPPEVYLHPGEPLSQWSDFASSPDSKKLTAWLNKEAFRILSDKKSTDIEIKTPPFFGRLGIFITLTEGRKVRGCFGSFTHTTEKLSTVLRDYLRGALRQDNRHKPPGIEELDQIDIILTITSQPLQMALSDMQVLDISRYGIVVGLENNEQPMVFVPAEIKTHSFLMKLVKKRKISSLSAFKAVTIK